MNQQLSIPEASRVWRLDAATRQRGRYGVAVARQVLQHARTKAGDSQASESSQEDRSLVADAA